MLDRSAKVRLEAETAGYISGMNAAAAATDKVAASGKKLEAATDGTNKALGGSTRAIRPAITAWDKFKVASAGAWTTLTRNVEATAQLGGVLTTAGAAMVAFSALSVAAFARFDSAMSGVAAATMATGDELESLRQAALDAGADTQYNAEQSANAITELAKAGVSSADILGGGLAGALNLAASGQIEVAEAAEIAAIAMKQFNLSGAEVPHIADLLAAGAAAAVGGVEDLGQALNQSGLVASQSGLSLEETVGSLSAFASAGMLGSDAGTAFKTMLQRLANPSGQAADLMDKLGISMYDANGEFVGMDVLAGQLRTSMENMTEGQRNAAMSIMFGSDAVRAANVLYSEGQAGIAGWTDLVNDSGFAAEQAAMLTDNLAGDFERLGGSFETALIGMGAGTSVLLRPIVQGLTGLIDLFLTLPEPIQGFVGAIGSIAGVATLAAGGFLLMVPKIVETKTALDALGITLGSVKTGFSNALSSAGAFIGGHPLLMAGLAVGIATAAAAMVIFNEKQAEAERNAAELAGAVAGLSDGVEALDIAARNVADQGLIPSINDAGYEKAASQLSDLGGLLDKLKQEDEGFDLGLQFELDNELNYATAAIGEYGDALAELAQTDLSAVGSQLKDLQDAYQLDPEQMWQLIDESDALKQALLEQATAAGVAVGDLSTLEQQTALVEWITNQAEDTSGQFAAQMLEGGEAAQEAAASIEEVTDALRGLDDQISGMQDDTAAWYQSLEDAKGVAEEFADSIIDGVTAFDLSTEAGREFDASVRDIAASTLDMAASQYEVDGSIQNLIANVQAGRDAFIEQAMAYGMTEEAANAYADALGLVPETIDTVMRIEAEEDEAVQAQLQQLIEVDGTTTIVKLSVLTEGAQSELSSIFDQLNSIQGPDGVKTITVDALTTEAQVALDALGAEVTMMEDGSFQIRYENQAEVDAALESLENKEDLEINLGANTSEFLANAEAAKDAAEEPVETEMDADTGPALDSVGEWQDFVEGNPALAEMDADTSKADTAASEWETKSSKLKPIPLLLADNAPASKETSEWVATSQGMRPRPKLDADKSPATGVTDQWVAYAKGQRPTGTLRADRSQANNTVSSWYSWANGLSARPTVSVRDHASSTLSWIQQLLGGIKSKEVTVTTTHRSVGAFAAGGAVEKFAAGGPVRGGIPGRDSVNALLMPGEHVLTTEEVQLMGGQGAVYAWRDMIRRNGGLPGVQKFADGGAVLAATSSNRPVIEVRVPASEKQGDSYYYDQKFEILEPKATAPELAADIEKLTNRNRRRGR